MVSAATRRPRGRRTLPRAGVCTALLVGAAVMLAALAAQGGSGERLDVTEHLVIGLAPDQIFEVLCDDSPIFGEPLASDALGLLAFEVAEPQAPPPNTISIGTDGSPAPLRIEGERACETTDVGAVICWGTNRPATSRVEYGLTAAYGSLSAESTDLVREHAVAIGPLEPETTYHYRVISVDVHDNASASGDHTFETLASPPEVRDVDIVDLGPTFFTVSWNTSEPCAHFIEYGIDETYGSSTPYVPDLVMAHEATVEGLESGTTYRFRIWSIDEQGRAFPSEAHSVGIPAPPLEILDVDVLHVATRSVTVHWTTTGPSDSQVEYGPDAGFGSRTDVDPVLTRNHVMPVEDLEPGSMYHLRAISTDEHGNAAVSEVVVVTTLDLDVTALVILDAAVIETTATTATLKWQTTNPAFTHVDYGETADCDLSTPESVEPRTEHLVTLTGLSPGRVYHFRIHARDLYGQETGSPRHTFTTKDVGGPGALAIVWVGVAEIEATRATVAWQTNSSSTSAVEYGVSGACDNTVSDGALVTLHSLTLPGLLEDTVYYYRVRSTDGSGQEAASDVSTFRTAPAGDLTPPDSPTGLAAVGCARGVELSWRPNDEADLGAYRVYRRAEDQTAFVEIAEVDASATCCVDEGAAGGRLYDYALAAVDLAGNESDPSSPVRAAGGLSGQAMVWVYRNPVRDGATIRFAAPRVTGTPGERPAFAVRIYDARGRMVRSVADGRMSGDVESVYWDATDAGGRRVASGVYFCVVSFPNSAVRTKLMVVR